MFGSHKPLILLVVYFLVSVVLSSHFRGGIIMVRPVSDEDLRGSGEGSAQPAIVMPVQVKL